LLGSHLLGWTPVGYVEFNNYCQRVIAQRIKDGLLPEAPIFSDIKAFIGEGYAEGYRGLVGVITAGFPCQPFSVAGKQWGADDERNMWPQTLATIRAVRPRFAFLENVPGLISCGYLATILRDLAESGYDARWCVLGARHVGAPHRRDRLWILANSREFGRRGRGDGDEAGTIGPLQARGPCAGEEQTCMADPEVMHGDKIGRGQQDGVLREDGWWSIDPADMDDPQDPDWGWLSGEDIAGRRTPKAGGSGGEGNGTGSAEPLLGRVAHGVASRVDRLKALGNGQVPAVVRAAWEILTCLDDNI
jgi:DNA (cytosine-5)-methyltransferase 1